MAHLPCIQPSTLLCKLLPPKYGPAHASAQQSIPPRYREDDVEVVDSNRNHFAVYAGEDSAGQQRSITFNEELGLAMEAFPEGVSLQQLSNVL